MDTTDTEQYIINRSYDPDYQCEVAVLRGDSGSDLKRIQVNSNGYIKVAI